MYISDFKYHKPKSLSEAYSILEACTNAAPIAGGSDLLVEIKQGKRNFDDIISLNHINELNIISEDEKNVYIGSTVTFDQISKSKIILANIPALAQAVSTIGTHQVRNTGTVGGNLCTCASCADSAPIMIAYNASVEVGSKIGIKNYDLIDFFVNHHVTILSKSELLTKIIIPKPSSKIGAYFEKFGLRESASISVASVAVVIKFDNDVIHDASIVIGACAPTPVKSVRATKLLIGLKLDEIKKGSEILENVGLAAVRDIFPIDDIRGGADYRKDIVKVLSQKVILKAVQSIKN